ncbi:MAG TPA: hypothetical protein VGG72_08825 [Bryobacteraceae bacterium]
MATVPLLIIDDFGMRKLPHTAAEDLLEIIMRRYERFSTCSLPTVPSRTGASCWATWPRSAPCLIACYITPRPQVRSTKWAHQDRDGIVRKNNFFIARALPSRSRDLSLSRQK